MSTDGVYQVIVGGDQSATGTYGFQLWNIPPVQIFDIAIGGSVAKDLPAAGAGNIETPGVRDVYRFTGTAGQSVYFAETTGGCLTPLVWRCEAPDGSVLFSERLGAVECGTDAGLKQLPLTGTYTITVSGEQSGTGSYGFQLSSR